MINIHLLNVVHGIVSPLLCAALLFISCDSLAISVIPEPEPDTKPIWTQFQGNAGHTGFVPGYGWPESQEPDWSFNTNPLLDATPPTEFTPGITSDGKKVFISWTGAPSTVNGVNALDIKTGTEVWEWTFTGNDAETISAPTYDEGKVYVHRWGHSAACGVDCHDQPRLFGIDTNSGAQIFDQTHAGQWSSGGIPAADNGEVFVAGGYSGGLDSYDGANGTIQWYSALPQRYGWIPAVDENHVYTSFGGNLTLLDRNTGDQQTLMALSNNSPGAVGTPVVVGPDEAYTTGGWVVTRFDPTEETAVWEYDGSGGNIEQGMAIGKQALFVNYGDRIVAVNRTTGAELWSWDAPSSLTSNVVLTNSHIYVASDTETYALSPANKTVDWSAPYGGELAIVSDHLFIANSQGLHAFTLPVPEPSAAWLFLAMLFVGSICQSKTRGLTSD